MLYIYDIKVHFVNSSALLNRLKYFYVLHLIIKKNTLYN